MVPYDVVGGYTYAGAVPVPSTGTAIGGARRSGLTPPGAMPVLGTPATPKKVPYVDVGGVPSRGAGGGPGQACTIDTGMVVVGAAR
jgi:hypothetical protein